MLNPEQYEKNYDDMTNAYWIKTEKIEMFSSPRGNGKFQQGPFQRSIFRTKGHFQFSILQK